jgi:glycosyltransferase involved in cell wall biosynthesis
VRILRTPSIPFIKSVKIGPSWSKPFLDLLLFIYAFILLLSNTYDVLHSHEESSFFAVILTRLFRVKHLYDMHSSLPQQLQNFKLGNWPFLIKAFEILEQWVLKTCDAVITIDRELSTYVRRLNPDIQQILIENLPIDMGSTAVSAQDLSKSCPGLESDGRFPLVYTGTFEAYQGLEILLQSLPLVKQTYPQVCLVLVGGQPQQIERLQALVKQEDIEEDVCFIGIVSPEEAMAYLDIAHILVSPRIEGTSVPLKIYSYLHSGKPIVATKLAAHTQVLDDSMAFLVEPTKQGLASGITCLLKHPDMAQRLGHQARQVAQEQYSMDGYIAKVAQVYQCLSPSPQASKKQLGSLEL